MENTRWLEYVHRKLVERGLVQVPFVLIDRAEGSPMSFAERNQVPLICAKDLLLDDMRIQGNSQVARVYREQIAEKIIEQGLCVTDSILYSIIESTQRYLCISVQRNVFQNPLSSSRDYFSSNTLEIEYLENDRKSSLYFDVDLGKDFSSATFGQTDQRSGEGASPEEIIRSDVSSLQRFNDELSRSPFNDLGPRDAADRLVDLVDTLYKRK